MPEILSACLRGYKTFSMLNSAEHEIDPADKMLKCCWHVNIY